MPLNKLASCKAFELQYLSLSQMIWQLYRVLRITQPIINCNIFSYVTALQQLSVLFDELKILLGVLVIHCICLQGSRNIYTKDGIFEKFLKDGKNNTKNDEKIIIFHCEFSSERGPKL